MRELQANELLKHYEKQYDFRDLFDQAGIMDAMTVKEEHYLLDIVGGEPFIEKLDPLKLRILRNGNSNRTEDADMLIYEDYWSIGRVYDTYYDVLSKKDIQYLEKLTSGSAGSTSDEWDDLGAYMDDS